MASRSTSSSGPDWEDLAMAMKVFQEQNQCAIEVTVSQVVTNGAPDLRFDAKAWPKDVDKRGARPLALSSAVCHADRFKTIGGALFYLMYRLDFAIAEHAWVEALGIEAKPPRTPE